MGFLNRRSGQGGEDGEARARRQSEDIARIAAGGIPQAAEERLRTLGAEAGQAFTSDLSVPEFALVRRAGLEPITQVLGSCAYHVGWQFMGGGWYTTSQELTTLSDAYNDCRKRAFDRLRVEAELAGADAVVGVRVTAARYEWATDLIEFQAIGTAVRAPELRTPAGPALTNLSGQDCALLLAAGHRPCGVIGATAVFFGTLYTWTQPIPTTAWGAWANVEMVGATQTWYAARHRVLRSLEADAAVLGAGGIVATQWGQEERPYESGDRLAGITFIIHALATAIAPGGGHDSAPIASILSLSKEPA
ncbi:MAG TPA: heavy metal-binding domain-containing protein [Gaiellales bacterium]|jgi:uncharacterized protein YbjQ (UPF0145 family)